MSFVFVATHQVGVSTKAYSPIMGPAATPKFDHSWAYRRNILIVAPEGHANFTIEHIFRKDWVYILTL